MKIWPSVVCGSTETEVNSVFLAGKAAIVEAEGCHHWVVKLTAENQRNLHAKATL